MRTDCLAFGDAGNYRGRGSTTGKGPGLCCGGATAGGREILYYTRLRRHRGIHLLCGGGGRVEGGGSRRGTPGFGVKGGERGRGQRFGRGKRSEGGGGGVARRGDVSHSVWQLDRGKGAIHREAKKLKGDDTCDVCSSKSAFKSGSLRLYRKLTELGSFMVVTLA